MAQMVNILLIDDIDGSEADETVQFGLDGTHYEIDLNLQHTQEIRVLLAPYIENARKVTDSGGRPIPPRKTAVNGSSNKKIRDWAKERGFKVNDRGRIPADIIAKYETENSR